MRFPFGTWKCWYCGAVLQSKGKLQRHIHDTHVRIGPDGKTIPWNKGLTSATDSRICKSAQKVQEGYHTGRNTAWCRGLNLSPEHREKISKSMKTAHAEGRAHNIGNSRWNHEPSWPEKWFMRVVENEFKDKNYVREYPFHGFSLDFAWPDKKLCIEIDGEQHERFPEYRARDARKDSALAAEGWQVLRLKWRNVYQNPKNAIQTARGFIDGPVAKFAFKPEFSV